MGNGLDPERLVRRWVYDRRIPYYKVGGRVLIDLADVDELMEAGRIPARHEEQRGVRSRR